MLEMNEKFCCRDNDAVEQRAVQISGVDGGKIVRDACEFSRQAVEGAAGKRRV